MQNNSLFVISTNKKKTLRNDKGNAQRFMSITLEYTLAI